MKKVRYICYLIAFVLFVIPLIPLPFNKPEVLHDIFSDLGGGLIALFLFGILVFCTFGVFVGFIYTSVRDRKVNKPLLIEFFFIPAALVIFSAIFALVPGSSSPDVIFSLNDGRKPEDFVNPYLRYKMLDCRNLTEEFDVIFVPSRIAIETEYLAFAPRRKRKTIDYIPGRKYGDDWYWEFSGSQWHPEFRNCVMQKNPLSS